MVRGIQKQVIYVKNPENSWCEEAFLIVRAGARTPKGETTMAEEVERMLAGTRIRSESASGGCRMRRWFVRICLLAGGVCLGAAVALLLV